MTTRGVTEIELITFENHTDCQCMLKGSVYSSTEPTRIDGIQLANDDPAPRAGIVARFNTAPITTTTETPARCRCPNHFTPMNGYQCKCDCSAKSSPTIDMCNRLRTGLEHFSIIERR